MIDDMIEAVEESLTFIYEQMSEKEQHAFDLGEIMGRVRAVKDTYKEEKYDNEEHR